MSEEMNWFYMVVINLLIDFTFTHVFFLQINVVGTLTRLQWSGTTRNRYAHATRLVDPFPLVSSVLSVSPIAIFGMIYNKKVSKKLLKKYRANEIRRRDPRLQFLNLPRLIKERIIDSTDTETK